MPGPRRQPAAKRTQPANAEGPYRALSLMVEALALLDLDGRAVITGAHLDLAIHRLREWIDKGEIK